MPRQDILVVVSFGVGEMIIDKRGGKMEILTWKYVKTLKDPDVVNKFLRKYDIVLPQTLLDCIVQNNGGRPSKKDFTTDKGREYVFKSLLSYNIEDAECIYDVYPSLFKATSLYPIGTDASGNFICYDWNTQKYVLLKHETNTIENIVL